MGHLNALRREHRDLVDRLGRGTVGLPEPADAKAREAWREILEILFTPEEAALASRLPVLPASLEALSSRLGSPASELKGRLDALADKGIVFDVPRGKTTLYALAPPVVGFFEFSMMRLREEKLPRKRLAEAMEAYFAGDPAFSREVFGYATQIGRALAHETALDCELPEVLDWERAEAIIKGARAVTVSCCYCRHKAEHLGKACGAPLETCLSLNGAAELVARRGFGERIPNAEALDIVRRARESRLVQIADNVQRKVSWICNCCACCCEQLRGVNRLGLPAVTPSGFVPRHRPDRCAGCSRCARACPASAIVMEPRRDGAEPRNALVPRVDEDRCIGCGVCVDECPRGALRLERRAKRPYVPLTAVEKALRQSLERGRLADLLVDAGAGQGPRLLNLLVRALCALPPIDRVLASEQARSRFVRWALANVPDPL